MFLHAPRFSVFMMWALIPLTVVGSLPRIGCICANGNHKLFCQRHLNRRCLDHSESAGNSALCACCYKSAATHASRPTTSLSRAVAGCCHHNHRPSNEKSVKAGCCTPLVGIPVLPPVAQNVAAPDLSAAQALLIDTIDLLAMPATFPTRVSVRNPDLPVPDLVIAHQVFLI
jgi:hypothetical protein